MTVAPSVRPLRGGTASVLILSIALIECFSGISQGYLITIVPGLGEEFHISDATVNGIFLISNVGFAVLAPFIPRLGDTYGHRRVLRWSIGVATVGALLMAVVPTLFTVIVGVVLVTVVVGFIPLMLGIMHIATPGRAKSGAGVMVGVLLLTVGLGGLLAGYIGQHRPSLGFWIAVPFAVIAVVCSIFLPDTDAPSRQRMAIAPFLACTIGLIGFVIALSMGPVWGWGDARTLGCGIVGLVLLAIWFVLDLTGRRQFVDLRILKVPHLRVNASATFFFGFASVSFFGTNGIFLSSDPHTAGYGFGYGAMQIAWVFTAIMAVSFVASVIAGKLLTLIGGRLTLALAAVLLAASYLSLLVMHGSLAQYAVGVALLGLGQGTYQSAVRPLSIEGVPETETATSAGVNELSLALGIAIGTAVIEFVHTSQAVDGRLTPHGLSLILIALAVGAGIALVISLFYRAPALDRKA